MNYNLCALYSGGKDSTYALHWAVFKGFNVVCLITILPKREDSWMFQYPNVEFTRYQAEVLEIPIFFQESSGLKEKELEDLFLAFLKAKELGAEGIVAGALLSDYQRLNINFIANKLNLKTFSPLWRKNQENYMRELIDEGFEYVITSASAYGFPFELVGKEVSREDIEKIILASKKFGFNPAFEGGEAETFVTYAPLFKRKLKIIGETIKLGEFEWRFKITHIL